MAFNHRSPDAIPALDVAALVKLISNSQVAAELWAKYEQVRKEYEALRTVIAAESDKLDKRAIEVADKEAKAEIKYKQVVAKEREAAEYYDSRVIELQSFESRVVSRESAVTAQEKNLVAKEAALKEAAKTWDVQVASDNTKLMQIENTLLEKNEAIAAREAAVAAREQKAEELAKLLRAV